MAQSPSVRILLPERTRLLQGQQVDLVLEVRNADSVSGVSVTAGTSDISSAFTAPSAALLDCDTSRDWVVRANLQQFNTPGTVTLTAKVTVGTATVSDTRTIQVLDFNPPANQRRNVILFIGDAMGTAYRDSARLVSRAILDANGKNSFREGYFDNLLEMDKMPVSGMSMTYGSDSIVPDSANTGSAWATGNKTYLNAVNVFTDGTDCRWRFNGQQNAATSQYIQDNPRVESLWQYLKRRFNYQAGIVSTAAITDATPAVEGSYTGYRQMRLEIARQFRENPMLGGKPAFDVILGGGADPFTAGGRAGADRRNLVQEFQDMGYSYVTNATQLKAVTSGPILGLFKGSASPATSSNGVATADVNMDVAYDKLGFQRPASEGPVNLGTWTDQPMLDLMTEKAINSLSKGRFADTPFILMVEGASIDKQSHPNNAAGTIWDTIEFDKAVGVARKFASQRTNRDTLVVVTADHDQSMSIIGVANVPDSEYFNTGKSQKISITSAQGSQDFTVYGDVYANARAAVPVVNTSTGASNNGGTPYMPAPFAGTNSASQPETSTYSTYSGSTAYTMDTVRGYPQNAGANLRRLAVGFRTGDHTGSSVPVTAEGPGALLFTGYLDQSDIFFKMAASISTDTTDMDKALDAIQSNSKLPKTFGK
jgi:alkaline phosphatase